MRTVSRPSDLESEGVRGSREPARIGSATTERLLLVPVTTPPPDQPQRPPFPSVAPSGENAPPPPPPPNSPSWPGSPAPRPAPYTFPATPAPGSPLPPSSSGAPEPSATDPADAKPEEKGRRWKGRGKRGKKEPEDASPPAEPREKRGLFGISWLGGSKKPDDSSGSGAQPPGDDDQTAVGGFFERASVLIVLGIFALVAVSSGVYLMFFRPEPVVLGPTVHFIPLPTPTFETVTPDGDSAFAAALPTSDLTYGLRSAEQNVWMPVTAWPTRFAEEWYLTYDDGAGNEMTVQAVQHYTAEKAKSSYDALLADAQDEIAAAAEAQADASPSPTGSPSPTPSATGDAGIRVGIVRVDGAQVGQSFRVVKDITETTTDPVTGDEVETTRTVAMVTWQNGTAVFVMTADPDEIDTLFLEYRI